MRRLKAGFLVLFSWVAAGCASSPDLPPPPEEPAIVVDNPTCVSCGAALDPAELVLVTARAASGDREAAFRLSAHYRSIELRAQSLEWELRAAQAGHPVAQYNQWSQLRESVSCADRLAALSWLERSAATGFSEAQEQLSAFRRIVEPCVRDRPRGASLLPNSSSKPTPLRGAA